MHYQVYSFYLFQDYLYSILFIWKEHLRTPCKSSHSNYYIRSSVILLICVIKKNSGYFRAVCKSLGITDTKGRSWFDCLIKWIHPILFVLPFKFLLSIPLILFLNLSFIFFLLFCLDALSYFKFFWHQFKVSKYIEGKKKHYKVLTHIKAKLCRQDLVICHFALHWRLGSCAPDLIS